MEQSSAVAVAVSVLLLASAIGPATAGTDGIADPVGASMAPGDVPSAEAASAVATQLNNSTRHEDPDAVDDSSDLQDVTRWLTGQLGSRLGDSVIQLSQGEYDAARQLIGDQYNDQLENLVDVAGETAGDGDDEASQTFNETRRTQTEFVNTVQEYRDTSEQYREAKQTGNERRARALARQLERFAGQVGDTTPALQQSYRNITNRTSANLTDASERIAVIEENISEQQAQIRAEEFVATRLVVDTESSAISYLDPLEATGRLTTENGTAVANTRVTLTISGRQQTATTNADGEFSFTYRPTTLPLGQQTVQVTYVPQNTSFYLGTNASVTVNVSQVTPSVTVASATNRTAFADQLRINGSVTVEESGAQGVPVALYLGETRIGATQTDVIGAFTLAPRVPASVPNGTQEIRAEVALNDSALASATANTSVTVEPTGTSLSVDGRQRQPDEVQLSGTLTTVDGTPVEGQVVRISIAGEFATTARTAASGAFATTVDIPSSQIPETNTTTVELTAQFDGEGTNLEPARSQTAVEIAPPPENGGASPDSRIPWPWLGVAGVVLLAGLGMAYRTFGRTEADSEPDPEPQDEPEESSDDQEPTDGDTASEDPVVSLDTAREQLEAGKFDRAVQTAYGIARTTLSRAKGIQNEGTHWEFYAACEAADLDAETLERLEQLTAAHERATFAPTTAAHETAAEAVRLAASFDLPTEAGSEA